MSCEIKIGELRNKVVLKHRVETVNEYGGRSVSWTQYASVWARLRPSSGSEKLLQHNLQNPITHNIVIRYRDDILESDMIEAQGSTYNIRSILNNDEKNRFLYILAETGVGQ